MDKRLTMAGLQAEINAWQKVNKNDFKFEVGGESGYYTLYKIGDGSTDNVSTAKSLTGEAAGSLKAVRNAWMKHRYDMSKATKAKLKAKVKPAKYKEGDMIYTYRNPAVKTPIVDVRLSDDPEYQHQYIVEVNGNKYWISEGSVFKTKIKK